MRIGSRTTCFVLAGFVIAAALLPLWAGDAQPAAAACNPYRSNDYIYRWVGTTRSVPAPVYGTDLQAVVEIEDAYTVVGSRSWVQIADSVHDKWVKTGYFDSGGYPKAGVEWKDGVVSHYYFNNIDYSAHTLYLSYLVANARTFASINAIGSYSTPPMYSFVPNVLQILGETLSHADQMPGTASNKLLVTGAKYEYDSIPWTAFAGTAVNSDPYSTGYGLDGLSTTSLDYWDRKCP